MTFSVLMYHHVGPRRASTLPGLTVSPRAFERHLQTLLRSGVRFAAATDMANASGASSHRVVLTFDDGYADLAEYAFPLLAAHGVPATVFVVTGLIGGTSVWDVGRGGGGHRLLTREQITAWAARGIEFGAHGRNHLDLTTLSKHELRSEVEGSREDLEAILGQRVTAFAYPYGQLDPVVSAVVRNVYSIAFTTREGRNDTSFDRFGVLRTMVSRYDTRFDVRLRAALGYSPIERVRRRVGTSTRRWLELIRRR